MKIILCKDYKYFGLQNGDGCYCGNDDSKFVPVAPEECNHPCSGNDNEICGASWRLSVYGPNNVTDLISIETTRASTTTVETTASMTTLTTIASTTTTTTPKNTTPSLPLIGDYYFGDCDLYTAGNTIIFETGSPYYSNNMRHGYKNKICDYQLQKF